MGATGVDRPPSPWAVWLTLAWILAVLMSLAAVALGLENLELALDFQRHLH